MLSVDPAVQWRAQRFPLGAAVDLRELQGDPYAVFARLQTQEPVSWIACLNMWYVTRYHDVRDVLLDSRRFTTVFERSTIHQTFGANVLTTEGAQHDRYRRAAQSDFTDRRIRDALETRIEELIASLIAGFRDDGGADLRAVLASRLPIQTVLTLCGLPLSAEGSFRQWYDHFEAALSNFTGDLAICERAAAAAKQLHEFLQSAIDANREAKGPSLLTSLMKGAGSERLSDEEVRRNLSIIFFGGISTVEALILNCLWTLSQHPQWQAAVRADRSLTPAVVEETMRWRSPVQSATRHALEDLDLQGASIKAGEVVNCMIGAANRDPRVFEQPEQFVPSRINVRRHLGFATGAHACLGLHLARMEARLAINAVLAQLPEFRILLEQSESPSGYEFHQPRRLQGVWAS